MKKSSLTVAAIQCALTDNPKENTERITHWVEKAAKDGAQVILPSELFHGHYFCKEEKQDNFSRAMPAGENPIIEHFAKLARALQVVIPISFFERDGQSYYNTVAMLNSTGEMMGLYRKSHIPDGPGYEEKYYFRPGNTGFRVWPTTFGNIGVGICWDQWFPECARAMVLQGAEVLLYPTAIGSEPANPDPLATKDRWQRAMVGHAVSNVVPVVAANRIGQEGSQSFYGHSFICDEAGSFRAELPAEKEGVITAAFDLAEIRAARAAWGFFRDRRPDLYGPLTAK
jgi:N-carbamoylputrescine amidase